jgi:hypothetical protein
MAWLTKAITAGYKTAAHLKKDTDVAPLRDGEDFKKLLAELDGKGKVSPETQSCPEETLFEEGLRKPPAEPAAFLEQACGGGRELRVARMKTHHCKAYDVSRLGRSPPSFSLTYVVATGRRRLEARSVRQGRKGAEASPHSIARSLPSLSPRAPAVLSSSPRKRFEPTGIGSATLLSQCTWKNS